MKEARKKLCSTSLIPVVLCSFFGLSSTHVHAIEPVQGLYAGITLGGSYAPNITYTFYNPLNNTTTNATATHGVLGDIGLQVGYRMLRNLRLEGQFLLNDNPYKSIKVNNTIITGGTTTGYKIKGQTITGALFANGFYDFISPADGCNVAPYLGAGIGYGYVKNSVKFYYNNLPISSSLTSQGSTPVVQGIVGISYFMDSFTFAALDLRYIATRQIAPLQGNPEILALNLTFNGMFDCG